MAISMRIGRPVFGSPQTSLRCQDAQADQPVSDRSASVDLLLAERFAFDVGVVSGGQQQRP